VNTRKWPRQRSRVILPWLRRIGSIVLFMLLWGTTPDVSADWAWSSWFASDDKPETEQVAARLEPKVSKAEESFDHFSTGFPLTGVHEQVTCENCHKRGVFKGTPNTCVGCHDGVAARGKSSNHVPSSVQCDDCHTTVAWTPAGFDHGNAGDNCASCHNGSYATGKSATHIQTTGQCGVCHTTTAWRPAQFDHSGVTGSCSSCHNGTAAAGKSPVTILVGHLPDQAALSGVLNTLYEMHLPLLSVENLDEK